MLHMGLLRYGGGAKQDIRARYESTCKGSTTTSDPTTLHLLNKPCQFPSVPNGGTPAREACVALNAFVNPYLYMHSKPYL